MDSLRARLRAASRSPAGRDSQRSIDCRYVSLSLSHPPPPPLSLTHAASPVSTAFGPPGLTQTMQLSIDCRSSWCRRGGGGAVLGMPPSLSLPLSPYVCPQLTPTPPVFTDLKQPPPPQTVGIFLLCCSASCAIAVLLRASLSVACPDKIRT